MSKKDATVFGVNDLTRAADTPCGIRNNNNNFESHLSPAIPLA